MLKAIFFKLKLWFLFTSQNYFPLQLFSLVRSLFVFYNSLFILASRGGYDGQHTVSQGNYPYIQPPSTSNTDVGYYGTGAGQPRGLVQMRGVHQGGPYHHYVGGQPMVSQGNYPISGYYQSQEGLFIFYFYLKVFFIGLLSEFSKSFFILEGG